MTRTPPFSGAKGALSSPNFSASTIFSAETIKTWVEDSLLLRAPQPLEVRKTEAKQDHAARVHIYRKAWYDEAVPAAFGVGAFDGFHKGHQQLIHDAVQYAHTRQIRCAAVLFDPDPSVLLDSHPQSVLLDINDRVRALAQAGVDAVIVLSCTHALLQSSYVDFCLQTLPSFASVHSLHLGCNTVLGRDGKGTIDALRELGAHHDFEVVSHELLHIDNTVVCATRIRRLLEQAVTPDALTASNALTEAHRLLGRAHFVRGRVQHGRGEGKSFGFPTANLVCESARCVPATAVYAGFVHFQNHAWPAAINVGAPLTFLSDKQTRGQCCGQHKDQSCGSGKGQNNAQRLLEAHLLGFSGNLYDQTVDVSFVALLRPSRKFPSIAALEKTVHGNIYWVKTHLGNAAVKVGELAHD